MSDVTAEVAPDDPDSPVPRPDSSKSNSVSTGPEMHFTQEGQFESAPL